MTATGNRNPLQQLHDYGQSVWYDNLSRQLLNEGGLQTLIDQSGVVGVTSNPTIFDKAITGSDAYDDQIRELVEAGSTTDEVYEELVVRDIQRAADILRPVFEGNGRNSGDGFVSLEVSPTLAHNTEKTMEDARRLYAEVDRPNVMIKIPGTPEGLPAIEQMLYEGVNVNITLLFSLDAYRKVAEAYLRALERRAEEGKPVDNVHSVASFFVSRVDTEADKRLEKVIAEAQGSDRATKAEALRGKLAIANAKLAYQAFKEIFESERFRKLQEFGARVQRPLWASTSTKNPAYSDTLYVDELIGSRTVQTLAPASIEAFGDHGTLGHTLESDIDAARQVFADLKSIGVSYQEITDTITREGVDSFAKSFESLLGGLDDKRQRFAEELQQRRRECLGPLVSDVDALVQHLGEMNIAERLSSRDAALWGEDDGQQASISNRLGWLPVVEAMLGEARSGFFNEFAEDVRARDYEFVVLLGMGGSSLAPDVFTRMFGPTEEFPDLIVLDTTNPDTITRVEAEIMSRKALFIVSTKSGTTVETMSLYRYFYSIKGENGDNFIAITDPGTPLDAEAQEKGFWKIFRNPADIGGRYSSLSYFGLVAAAAMGVDVEEMLLRARRMLHLHDANHPGVWLGAVLGAAQKAGRDKLTIVSTLGWEPYADWLEQLIAESSGKRGTGVLPVIAESIFDTSSYGDDRLFVYFRGANEGSETDEFVEKLREAGHPIVEITVGGPLTLGREFVRWEIAIAVAGVLLGINPFDEPNVQEAKDATNAVLKGTSSDTPGDIAPQQAGEQIASMVKPGGYLAILAYVDPTDDVQAALAELRNALWSRTGVAVTIGVGPRYLHSTGQIHKGGPENGAFLMIVENPNTDIEIPEAEFTFADLFAAQSSGDAITLSRHGLPLARVVIRGGTIEQIQSITNAIQPSGAAAD